MPKCEKSSDFGKLDRLGTRWQQRGIDPLGLKFLLFDPESAHWALAHASSAPKLYSFLT
jgi:hypothetical protein